MQSIAYNSIPSIYCEFFLSLFCCSCWEWIQQQGTTSKFEMYFKLEICNICLNCVCVCREQFYIILIDYANMMLLPSNPSMHVAHWNVENTENGFDIMIHGFECLISMSLLLYVNSVKWANVSIMKCWINVFICLNRYSVLSDSFTSNNSFFYFLNIFVESYWKRI